MPEEEEKGEEETEEAEAGEAPAEVLLGDEKHMSRKARKRAGKVAARRKREFTYRGRTLEQLKALSLPELMKLFPARVRRSMKRGFTDEQQRFLEALRRGKDIVETHCRDMVILPELVGRKIGVHMGNTFTVVEVQPDMVGHYLGEFTLTRKFQKHAGPGVGATRSSKFMPLK